MPNAKYKPAVQARYLLTHCHSVRQITLVAPNSRLNSFLFRLMLLTFYILYVTALSQDLNPDINIYIPYNTLHRFRSSFHWKNELLVLDKNIAVILKKKIVFILENWEPEFKWFTRVCIKARMEITSPISRAFFPPTILLTRYTQQSEFQYI